MANHIDRILEKAPYVIAEIGINHNGDMALAKEMIDAAHENGAHCVKFQNFKADVYISTKAPRAGYQEKQDTGGKSQHDIIKECEIDRDQTAMLMEYAAGVGVDFLSTPFETQSLQTLLDLELPAIKVSSCNLTNYPFLEMLAASGRPALLSTGMGDLCEVIKAVDVFVKTGAPFMLFQCTSNYPAKIENANLRVIETYQRLFGVPVGLSDHTPTNTTCIAAVALGAVALEKHFTISRSLPGIDQQASIEPHELAELARAARDCRLALGSPLKSLADEEHDTKAALRRSLVAARDLKAGEVLTQDLVAIKRPGHGLTTDFLPHLLGRKLARAVGADELLGLDDFLTT